MKITAIYSDKEGILRACVEPVPVEPKYSDYVRHTHYYWQVNEFERKKRDYQKALQRCKDSSVPFEDQKEARFNHYWRNSNFATNEIKPDTFYPCDVEVEIVHTISAGWQPTYNNPDNSGCEQPAEPIEVARLSPI